MTVVDSRRQTLDHSHSIINERSKLWICNAFKRGTTTFTVTSTVNRSGISIGAGLQAIRLEVTFRDPSTSIDSGDYRGHHRRASASVRATPKMLWHRTP